MGTGEETTQSKSSKPTSSSQEVPATPYPDWSSSMQAYYGAGAPPSPFFPSPVPSPSPHPYVWGAQHPMIPPYGTPVPYPAMYPPGGIFTHPGITMAPCSAPTNAENTKDQASAKKSKGTAKGKGREGGKAASGSGNDGVSQSDESGTEGSSEGSDEKAIQQENASNKKGSFKQILADATSHSKITGTTQVSSHPATNLNIGMDLWSSSAKMGSNASGSIVPAPMPEQWIQDERELKRQKRKQSNRESARRSRLRKQAECEQLQQRVESLTHENESLREEFHRLSEECEKLTTENNSIKDELTRLRESEAVANLEQSNNSAFRSNSAGSI